MSTLDEIMRRALVYRLWMAPFAARKFAPVAANSDLSLVRRVLDVGCGPGTNANYFSSVEYLGIDLNQKYISDAKQRYRTSRGQKEFMAVDAAKFVPPSGKRFDFVLVNSFLHHVDDSTARAILSNLSKLLTDDGHVHILDLVLPGAASLAGVLARSDRGDFPRPLETWHQIFCESFEQVLFEPYDLRRCGLTLWKMVYFKGKARH
jgi:SAM-dependent methyltransferase